MTKPMTKLAYMENVLEMYSSLHQLHDRKLLHMSKLSYEDVYKFLVPINFPVH